MSQHDAPRADGQASGRIPYAHGGGSREQRRLERRTAANAAAFFLPYLRPGMRLLDCGCGVGSITVGLAEAVAPGEVVGIDLQPSQIERARILAAERGVANVRFEIGSVYELPFPNASFDAGFAHTLLFHLRDPLKALREIRRVLKPGGVVGAADDDRGTFILTPETPLLDEAHRLMQNVVRHHGGNPFLGRHERRLLLDAGFSRVVASPTFKTGQAQGTLEETRQFGAWLVDQLRQPALVELVTSQALATEATLDAMAEAILAWAERPDAYAASMGVAAVGWIDG